jgi:hypothetical protein
VQLKPDVRQVRQMLDHRDSPFIRAVRAQSGRAALHVNASTQVWVVPRQPPLYLVCCLAAQIGLLYLRYVCDPRQLWEWFRTYLRDEEVRPLCGGVRCLCCILRPMLLHCCHT